MNRVTVLALCVMSSAVGIHAKFDIFHNTLDQVKRHLVKIEKISKMSQEKKNKKLRHYLKKVVKNRSFYGFAFFVSGSYLTEIRDLIQCGASPNVEIPYQTYTYSSGPVSGTFKPIYLFLANHDEENVRMLLEHGASLKNIIQVNGEVADPLYFANTESMINVLLAYGAQIKQPKDQKITDFGKTDPKERFHWAHQDKFGSLIEAIISRSYDAKFIPIYCAHYKGNVVDFAQEIWNALMKAKWNYHSTTVARKEFHQKKEYLRQAGALIDEAWDSDSFVWEE